MTIFQFGKLMLFSISTNNHSPAGTPNHIIVQTKLTVTLTLTLKLN